MAHYERLSAQDSSFLYAESPVAHMHVGVLVVAENRGLTEDALCAHIESRLHRVPRFREKLAWVPFGQGRPVWVDDPHFDLRFHIRPTGLPKPTGMREALRLMGRIMSIPLDRSRPLWEMWMFDLPGRRKGIIQKTHHCMIDGVSGVDLATVILDFEPSPPPAEPPPPWTPRSPPTKSQLLVDSLVARLQQQREIDERLRHARAAPQEFIERATEIVQGLLSLGKATMEPAPRISLSQPIGAHRRFEIVRVDLEAARAIKNRHGCKINDVVLALVAGGLGHLLRSRGEATEGLVLRAMVPVSVRDPSDRMTYGNKVSMMAADLPVGENDPAERLRLIAAQMAGLKESKQAVGADFWLKLSEYASPTVLALASRAMALQRSVNLCVTNVPGPQFPLHLLGGKILEMFPYVPLFGTMSVGAAVFSYDGQLNFGLSGDWDLVPDLGVLAEGIERSVKELGSGAASRRRGRVAPKRRARAP